MGSCVSVGLVEACFVRVTLGVEIESRVGLESSAELVQAAFIQIRKKNKTSLRIREIIQAYPYIEGRVGLPDDV